MYACGSLTRKNIVGFVTAFCPAASSTRCGEFCVKEAQADVQATRQVESCYSHVAVPPTYDDVGAVRGRSECESASSPLT